MIHSEVFVSMNDLWRSIFTSMQILIPCLIKQWYTVAFSIGSLSFIASSWFSAQWRSLRLFIPHYPFCLFLYFTCFSVDGLKNLICLCFPPFFCHNFALPWMKGLRSSLWYNTYRTIAFEPSVGPLPSYSINTVKTFTNTPSLIKHLTVCPDLTSVTVWQTDTHTSHFILYMMHVTVLH